MTGNKRGTSGRWIVSNEKRNQKRQYRNFSEDDMRAALQERMTAIANGNSPPSFRVLSERHGVPKSSLCTFFNELVKEKGAVDASSFTLPQHGPKKYFTDTEERIMLGKAAAAKARGFGYDRSSGFMAMARDVVVALRDGVGRGGIRKPCNRFMASKFPTSTPGPDVSKNVET